MLGPLYLRTYAAYLKGARQREIALKDDLAIEIFPMRNLGGHEGFGEMVELCVRLSKWSDESLGAAVLAALAQAA